MWGVLWFCANPSRAHGACRVNGSDWGSGNGTRARVGRADHHRSKGGFRFAVAAQLEVATGGKGSSATAGTPASADSLATHSRPPRTSGCYDAQT
jgi:hypothetical protein